MLIMATQGRLKSLHTTSALTAAHQNKKKDINVNTDVDLQFQTFISQTTKRLKEILPF